MKKYIILLSTFVYLFSFENNLIAQCETIITSNSPSYSCKVGEGAVVWKNIGVNTSQDKDTLIKINANAWNGGANSVQTVTNGGYFYTILNENNTRRMVGFSNNNTTESFTDIDFAFYPHSNGRIYIYESGVNRGDFGSYNSGDTLKQVAVDGKIYYYVNNKLLHTSITAPTYPLFVDISLNTIGATISNVFIGEENTGTFNIATTSAGASPTYQWQLNGSNVGTNSATYTNIAIPDGDTLRCIITFGAGGCLVGNDTSNFIVMRTNLLSDHSALTTMNVHENITCRQNTEKVIWNSQSANVVTTINGIQKVGSVNNWSNGVSSFNTVDSSGYAFTIINEENTARMFGLNKTNTSTVYSDIDHAFYLRSNRYVNIYEEGTNVATLGRYNTGDRLKIALEYDKVVYYINGVKVYTSAVVANPPYVVDASLYHENSTIEHVYVVNGTTGDYQAEVVGAGTSPTYQWYKNGSPTGLNQPTFNEPTLNINDAITCVVTPDISGCASATISSTDIIYNETDPSINSVVGITQITTASLCKFLEEEVAWTDISPGITVDRNNLTKTEANGWTSGAASIGQVLEGGYVQTIIAENNTARMIGLSNGNTNYSFNTIDYAFYPNSNGYLYIYESGVSIGNMGRYDPSDTLKVAIQDNQIVYYINGVIVRTSPTAPTLPMIVDLSLNTTGATLKNVTIFNGTNGDFVATATNAGTSPTYQWKLNGANVGTNSTTYSNAGLSEEDSVWCVMTPDFPGCIVTDVTSNKTFYSEVDPGEYASVVIANNNIASLCNTVTEEIGWINQTSNLEVFEDSLKKDGPNGWNVAATSFGTVANDGYFTTIAGERNTRRMIGLSNTVGNYSYTTIDYAFYMNANGYLHLYESGANLGNFGRYFTGDTLKIAVENNIVSYYVNGTKIYTSATPPTLPLLVDISLYDDNATVKHVTITNGAQGNFTALAFNAGTAPTYQWVENGANVGANTSTYSNPSLNHEDSIWCIVTPDAPGCVTNTQQSNKVFFNIDDPADNSDVIVTNDNFNIRCEYVEEYVGWEKLSANIELSGDTIRKTGGVNGWSEGGASLGTVIDNGFMTFIASDRSSRRMVGLSNTSTNNSFNSIDYALYLHSNGYIYIYESGVNTIALGQYLLGDTFKIAVESGQIAYYLNNTILYNSATTPTLPLIVDFSIYDDGGTFREVKINNGTQGNFTATTFNAGAAPTYQWQINSSNVGANSSTYSNGSLTVNDTIKCIITPDAPGCTPGTATSNQVVYFESDPTENTQVIVSNDISPSLCEFVNEEIGWTNITSYIEVDGNNLTKDGPNGWNAGAASIGDIDSEGYLFTVVNETNLRRMIGLSNVSPNYSYNSIDFAVYLNSNGRLYVYESGTNRGEFGPYSSGDTIKVAVESNVVIYYLNNTPFYTSLVAPVLPLIVDVSLHTDGATLENVVVHNGTSGNFTATPINGGTTPTYQWKLNGANVGANSNTYTNNSLTVNDTILCLLTPDAPGCVVGDTASNILIFDTLDISDKASIYIVNDNHATPCSQITEEVTWTNINTNVEVDDNNDLIKTGSNGWNADAFSTNSVLEYGGMYTVVNEINRSRMIGLSVADVNSSYNRINYAFYLLNGGTLRVYEYGINMGDYGTFTTGDTVKVVSENDSIKYYKNSTLVYTSTVLPTFPMYVDLSIHAQGGTFDEVHIFNGSTGDFTATAISAGTSPTYQWKLNGSDIIGATNATYNNPNLGLNDQIDCEIMADAPGCLINPQNSNYIDVTLVSGASNWLGGTSNNWFVPANWSDGIPGPYTDIVISAGGNPISISGGNANCGNITIDGTGTLEFAGTDSLMVHGDWTNNGTFTPGLGAIVFNEKCDETATAISNSSAQDFHHIVINNSAGADIDAGSINLKGGLKLMDGQLNTNNSLTIVSDAVGDGYVAEITGGSITGDVLVQRYINAGSTDWRFLTAPISGATLSDWDDDITTSGFPGSDFPSFSFINVNFYDESAAGVIDNGFTDATNITNTVSPGQGVWVWCGDTITGTDPFTIDMEGPINTGDINLPITYTNSGDASADGWNMVGNPYPAAINWDDPDNVKINIAANIYVWNPDIQQFASYGSGIGINGGSRYIASSQAFWVKATAAAAGLTFKEASKTTVSANFLRQSQNQQLMIDLTGPTGQDQSIIVFDPLATSDYDQQIDGVKMASFNPNVPVLHTISTDNENLSVNYLNHQEIDIPLMTKVSATGTYTLKFSDTQELDSLSCLSLVDHLTGTSYDLFVDSVIQIILYDSLTVPRFSIHLGAMSHYATTDASCYGENDGEIVLNTTAAQSYEVHYISQNGDTVATHQVTGGNDTLTNVLSGDYEVIASFNGCGNANYQVTIDTPDSISVDFDLSTDTIILSQDDSVTLTNNSTNGTTYQWLFGDGTTSTDTMPTHTYDAAGIYTIDLYGYNGNNCFASSSKQIVVRTHPVGINDLDEVDSSINYTINGDILTLFGEKEMASVIIYNLIGEEVLRNTVLSEKQIDINLSDKASQSFIIHITYKDQTTDNLQIVK